MPDTPPTEHRPGHSPRGGIARPAVVYALLFGGVGAYFPYLSIYLQSTGLDIGMVGALIGLHAAVSLVAAPAWGALADGIGDVRGPILAAGILATIAAILLAVVAGPLAVAATIAFLAAATAGTTPMVDSRAVRMAGQRDRFGRARAWGSAAFVAVAIPAGVLIGRTGPQGMFLIYAPLLFATGLMGWLLLRLPDADRDSPGGRDARRGIGRVAGLALAGLAPATILGVLRQPRLGMFFVAMTVIWIAHATLMGFVSLRIVALGGDPTIVGATWSVGAILEVPLMLAFPAFVRRFGAERLIVVGALAFALRAIFIAVAPTPELILVASAFGGIGFSFVYLGAVVWVASSVRRDVQATAQGIFSGTSVSIGAILGSVVGGAIGGALGLPALFAIAAAGFVVGAVLVWLALAGGASRPSAIGSQ